MSGCFGQSDAKHGGIANEGRSLWDRGTDVGLFLRLVVLLEGGLLGADDSLGCHGG